MGERTKENVKKKIIKKISFSFFFILPSFHTSLYLFTPHQNNIIFFFFYPSFVLYFPLSIHPSSKQHRFSSFFLSFLPPIFFFIHSSLMKTISFFFFHFFFLSFLPPILLFIHSHLMKTTLFYFIIFLFFCPSFFPYFPSSIHPE
jgi:hypothetical protein